MRIYLTVLQKRENELKPDLERLVFGSGCSLTVNDFVTYLFCSVWRRFALCLVPAFRNGNPLKVREFKVSFTLKLK